MWKWFRKKSNISEEKTRLAYTASFLLGLGGSLATYTASTYFSEAFDTDNVSIAYGILAAANFIGILSLRSVIRRLGRATMLFVLIALSIASTFVVSIVGVSVLGSMFLIAFLLTLSLLWVTLDGIVEVFSADSQSGRIRGMYLASMNMGLLVGPIISGNILGSYGYEWLYFAALLFFSFFLGAAFLAFRDVDVLSRHIFTPKRQGGGIRSAKEFFRRPDLRRIYGVSFALDFFYAIVIVYAPIRMLELGMSWADIGLIITIALIPFVLLQYPMGRLADKYLGEKELLLLALAIMAIALSFFPRMETGDILPWMILMFSTRVGAAIVEVLRDSYFYKKIDGGDGDFIVLFRTSWPIAYLTMSVITSVFFVAFPVSQIFWLAFGVVVVSMYLVLRLRDNPAYGK
jgi:MFS family permease